MSVYDVNHSLFSNQTALYIEDLNKSQHSIENYLKKTFQDVLCTMHVHDAMQLLIGNKVDMLIVDLYEESMSERTQFLNNLKCLAPYLPIVVVVKESCMLKVVSSLDYCVSHVMLKPIERVILEKELQKVYSKAKSPKKVQYRLVT